MSTTITQTDAAERVDRMLAEARARREESR